MNLQTALKTGEQRVHGYKLSIDTFESGEYGFGHRIASVVPIRIVKQIPGGNGQENQADHQHGGKSRANAAEAGNSVPSAETRPLAFERRARSSSGESHTHIKELEALAQSLLQARERQRQLISRELHDNIAQVLCAATNRISMAKDEKIPAWLRQELQDLREQLTGALDDVRTLARELRPAILDRFGFAAALEKHADAFRARTRMSLEVRIDPDAVDFLKTDHLTHLFRLAQEALQNIEEHSAAKRAWIDLSEVDGGMHLEIGDDGCAFTAERVTEAQRNGHLGLLGMRERAEMLGGRFLLQAVPDQGTVIRISVPQRRN